MSRFILLVSFLLTTTSTISTAQTFRIGVVLEGQVLPFGLAVFTEIQSHAVGSHLQVGWDFAGGWYVSGELFHELSPYFRYAGGLIIYPGYGGALPPEERLTGPLLFLHAGTRKPKTGWGHIGVALPFNPDFYSSLTSDWSYLALLRTRLQITGKKSFF